MPLLWSEIVLGRFAIEKQHEEISHSVEVTVRGLTKECLLQLTVFIMRHRFRDATGESVCFDE